MLQRKLYEDLYDIKMIIFTGSNMGNGEYSFLLDRQTEESSVKTEIYPDPDIS